jgi:hypothetical protein
MYSNHMIITQQRVASLGYITLVSVKITLCVLKSQS